MKQLSCEQAKQIDMVDYLSSLNHHPQRVHHQDFWYLSPLREERTASFKVNRILNVWFDFGIGKGGDIIDFSTLYHNCTISEALLKLSGFQNQPTLSFQPPTVFVGPMVPSLCFAGEKKDSTESKIVVQGTRPLSANSLIEYLNKRHIPLEIASKYCQEVDFTLNGKQHTVIGFPNNSGGFELRNESCKGSSSPKDTTFIDNKTEHITVFEGFFSFLSFCTINKTGTFPITNSLILNSLSFLDKSRELLDKHLRVHLLLDQDAAGKTHTQKALDWNPNKYIDRSELYRGHKDLNDWLAHHQMQLQRNLQPKRRI